MNLKDVFLACASWHCWPASFFCSGPTSKKRGAHQIERGAARRAAGARGVGPAQGRRRGSGAKRGNRPLAPGEQESEPNHHLLKDETNRLEQANQKLTQQLAAIGETAQQQQERLKQWQAASLQARTVVQQSQSQAVIERNACIANLKLIDAAKLQWALLNNKAEDAIPTKQDLLQY